MGIQFPPAAIPPAFPIPLYCFYCMDGKVLLKLNLNGQASFSRKW